MHVASLEAPRTSTCYFTIRPSLIFNDRKQMAASNSGADSIRDLTRKIWSHEVAIAEINNLPSSRAIYQKNGNIYFRTSIQKATAFEQKQLDAAKAKHQKLNSP